MASLALELAALAMADAWRDRSFKSSIGLAPAFLR
jgi:hypothetical protein